MDSKLSDHYMHWAEAYISKSTSIHNTINTSNPSSFNFFHINSELSPSLRLPTLAKAETHLCFPEFFREHFVIRSDNQQNEEQELSCLSKSAPTAALPDRDLTCSQNRPQGSRTMPQTDFGPYRWRAGSR